MLLLERGCGLKNHERKQQKKKSKTEPRVVQVSQIVKDFEVKMIYFVSFAFVVLNSQLDNKKKEKIITRLGNYGSISTAKMLNMY